MTCPICHTANPEGALSCSRCSSVFPRASHDAETHFEPVASGGSIPEPSKAAGTSDWAGSWRTPAGSTAVLEPGSDFGTRYRIDAVLGRGGMGSVYKAYDKALDRTVALKLVRPELTNDPDVMQRFRQELLLASRVSHKNILRIHDLGDVDGLKFISMAYIEGEDLHHLLKREGRLPVERAVEITRQLCAALTAAHAEGVVHRDLKPQNVLLDQAGNAYISDFGLAKSLEAGTAVMTRSGELLGTPLYMSPEQVEGQPADHRSDLYALGLILYEMLTGEVPFAGGSTFKVMYQRLKEDPKNPRLLNPDVPSPLADTVLRCLERDAARRYQSAQEIVNDLDSPPSRLSLRGLRVVRPKPRHKPWLIGALVALVGIALGMGVLKVRDRWRQSHAPAGVAAGPAGIPALSRGEFIAVLPFRVLGDQSSLGYLGEGLQDALGAKLFQLQGAHITSGEAVEKAGSKVSLDAIAREVGANLIVEGTVQQAGGRIAIDARLHDMTTGKLMWSQEFPGVPRDLLTLEDEIYSQLVAALELKPSDAETARATQRPTENAEAYDEYLKGRDALRGQQDPKNIETAIRFFNDALKRDPGFALAYSGLADASVKMYADKKDRFWTQKALQAAEQAERLNGNLPEVHFTLGSVYNATGKTNQAIEELKRGLELAPNSDDVYRRLGTAYLSSGRKDEAIAAFEKAVQIAPYYWQNYNTLGQAYFETGENQKALAAWSKISELEPDNVWGYENVGAVYLVEGKFNDAIPVFQKALALEPTADNDSNVGTAYFYLKRYDDAARMFAQAVQMHPNDEVFAGNLADTYRWSGQTQKANFAYDKAISLAYKDLEVNPRSATTMEHLALYYAKKGNPDEARQQIRAARAIDAQNVDFLYAQAVVESLAGNHDQALEALRQAFEKGYSPELVKNDPEFANLQGNPEFQKLLGQFSSPSK